METNQKPAAKVALTVAAINGAQSPNQLMEMIGQQWATTYNKASGTEQGEMKWASEKVLFLQTLSGNKAFEKVENFSKYAALTELAISGLSLRDGIAYIVPFGKTCTFMPGWKGRLEQINEMPNVVHCHEPIVVYDCDEFDFDLGNEIRINKHKRGTRTPESKIIHVYFVIDFREKSVVYMMDAPDVLNIRDQHSSSYKQYVALCKQHDKTIGSTFQIQRSGQNGSWNQTIEPPMWVSDEAQAFKKTIVKRVYNTLPKLPKHKWLDEKVSANVAQAAVAGEVGNTDGDEMRDFAKYNEMMPKADQPAPPDAGKPAEEPKPEIPASPNPGAPVQNSAISEAQVISETKNSDLAGMIGNPNEGF